jgi:hypothetical protein
MPLPLQRFSSEVTGGDSAGTGGRQVGTSGTGAGTNGGAPWWAAAVVGLLLLAKGVVDAESIIDTAPELPMWRPYVLELTSAAFFMLILWPLWQLSRRLRPPRIGWPAALMAHAALTVPLVLLHAGWLAISRKAIFAMMGTLYRFDWSAAQLLFEWRKDALTLVALAGLGWLLDRLFAPPQPPALAPAPPPPFRLPVKDGNRVLLLAAHEISHASSAGNYVELATVHGPILHRVTLAALATELAPHGFVRIHRAHVVRASAVTEIASESSGDFAVTLADGTRLPGSRRWRDGLERLAPNLRR